MRLQKKTGSRRNGPGWRRNCNGEVKEQQVLNHGAGRNRRSRVMHTASGLAEAGNTPGRHRQDSQGRRTMKRTENRKWGRMIFGALVGGLSAFISIWAMSAMIAALYQSGWSVGELARQYLQATGISGSSHTLVEYYTHIKGIEYLICVVFFIAFPAFYTYINREEQQRQSRNPS